MEDFVDQYGNPLNNTHVSSDNVTHVANYGEEQADALKRLITEPATTLYKTLEIAEEDVDFNKTITRLSGDNIWDIHQLKFDDISALQTLNRRQFPGELFWR